MAAAENITFPSHAVQNPHLVLRMTENVSPVLVEEEPERSSGRKAKTRQLTTSLTAKSSDSPKGYLAQLAAYMLSVLETSINNTNNQQSVTSMQTTQSNAFVEMAKQIADQISQNVAAQAAAAAKAANQSWWQRVVSAIVSTLMIVIGAITLQPEIALAGLIMMATTVIPVDSKGDTAMGLLSQKLDTLGLGAKIGIEIAIDIVMAVVLAGAGSINAVAMAGEEGAEIGIEAAGEATAEDGTASGASAAADAADGAGSAAEDVEEAEAGANSVVENGEQITKSAAKQFAKKLFQEFAQSTMILNPFTDIVRAILNGPAFNSLSPEKKDEIAQYTGMAISICLNLTSLLVGVEKSLAGFESKLASLGERVAQYGPKAVAIYKGIVAFLELAKTGFNIAAGSLAIVAGKTGLDTANLIKEMGGFQSSMQVDQSLIGMFGASIKQSQSTAEALNQNLSMMNSRWDAYAAPYVTAAEVMA